MKKIDFGQAITVLANAGVIVGIVFLAIEIQQNNQLLRAEAVGALLETRMSQNQQVSGNPGMASVLAKNERGEALSEDEFIMVRATWTRGFLGWQREFLLYQEGVLDEAYLRTNIPLMKYRFRETSSTYDRLDHWQVWQNLAPPAFIEFVERCVFSDCESLPR